MKNNFQIILVFILLPFILQAQGKLEEYKRAEKYTPDNMEKVVFNERVNPNWINNTDDFWYMIKTRRGNEFFFVSPGERIKKPLFDHEKIAGLLSAKKDTLYNPYQLPFKTLEFTPEGKSITFKVDGELWNYNPESDEIVKTVKDKAKGENVSPDGKWQIITRNFNLYQKSTETGEEKALTSEGTELYDYGYWPSWYAVTNETNPARENREISVTWSPDSKKFITYRLDRTGMQKLYLLKSVTGNGFRPEVYSYERALVGDTLLTLVEYIIFDIEKGSEVKVDLGKQPAFLSWSSPEWFKDSRHLNYFLTHRFHRKVEVMDIEAETGKTRLVCTDSSDTYVDPGMFFMNVLSDGEEVIISSEREGRNHLYLFDWKSGKLKNQITKGDFVVREITKIDEDKKVIYFRANGREEGDPYFRKFYSVNYEGSGLTLLTPETADHLIDLSPGKKYFVDNYSTIETKPKAVLRSALDGSVTLELEEADYEDLYEMGFRHPKAFKVKARDGETDIYGALYYPSNFDSAKRYPVIIGTYSGPHTIRTAKYKFNDGYSRWNQSLAELGFIVFNCDGLGSAFRSKSFHEKSYMNLGDIGYADHKAALEQLREEHPYIDIERIGIWGHSAGGYDAAHALLAYPEFYDVGVSVSADHDHRMEKIWWPELWMGPIGDHYNEQSNVTLAGKGNLRGKLLLMHGDMDNNVNPDATLAVADALIKANKDFDMLIMPGYDHGSILYNNYFLRKKWDYFVKYLLGVDPPKEFKFGESTK